MKSKTEMSFNAPKNSNSNVAGNSKCNCEVCTCETCSCGTSCNCNDCKRSIAD